MPKLKKSTAKLKAQRLTKVYVRKGFNQAAVARAEGVSRVAINKRIHKKPVQDCLAEFLKSDELERVLMKVANEGLGATRLTGASLMITKKGKKIESISGGVVKSEDHNARHRFWHDLMLMKGHLKGESGTRVQVFVGAEVVTRIKEMEGGQVKSNSSGRLDD